MKAVLAGALLALVVLGSCATFPGPRGERDGLLVLVAERSAEEAGRVGARLSLEGPESLTLALNPNPVQVVFRRLPAGRYRVSFAGQPAGGAGGAGQAGVTVAPGSVTLCPLKALVAAGAQVELRPVQPEDQRRASETLTDYIGFEQWMGSAFEGFGPYRPRYRLEKESYSIQVASDPEGAQVVIDEQNWGRTPIPVQLSAGKHLLKLDKEGFQPVRKFVTVEGDGEINTTLSLRREQQAEEAAASQPGTYHILLAPFENLGDGRYDFYEPVFFDTLKIGLGGNPRLVVLEGTGAEEAASFAEAERSGAELLVRGEFQAGPDELFVYAGLYDVKSERVKTAVVYTGESGFSVFDSIDALASEFADKVAKVLPEPGSEIIEESQEVTQEIVTYERKITQREIIARRVGKPNSAAAYVLFGQTGDPLGTDGESRMPGELPLAFGFTYERVLTPLISANVRLNPVVRRRRPEQGGAWQLDLPLCLGPQLYLRGYRSDITMALLGRLTFASAFTADLSGLGPQRYGPYFLFGAMLDTGFKYYLSRRLSRPAPFFGGGFMFNLVEGRVNADFSNLTAVPIDVWMYLGSGVTW